MLMKKEQAVMNFFMVRFNMASSTHWVPHACTQQSHAK